MYQFRVVVYVLKWDLELEKKLKKERKKERNTRQRQMKKLSIGLKQTRGSS